MAAALGRDLIFDMDRRHAGPLEFPHTTHEIDRIAVTGVGIGDNRNLYRRDYLRRRALIDSDIGHQADIRDAHAARDRAAAQVGGLETGFLDESGGKTVETAGRDQEFVALVAVV